MGWKHLEDAHLRETLKKRSDIVRAIRAFFDGEEFVEVMTPRLVRLAGQEPYLDPIPVDVKDVRGFDFSGFLITSPEYSCKKMLAAGFDRIYDLGVCFRNGEEFGGLHNPEFTMLEWYRVGVDYIALMDDIDRLLAFVSAQCNVRTFDACERMSIDECFVRYCNQSIKELLDTSCMIQWARNRGYDIAHDERYEDVFYRIFLNEIESKLGLERPTIVYDYPACMASLARLNADDVRFAERCELYIDGVEIANGFSELVDGEEQRVRLVEEQKLRLDLGRDVYDVDEDFLDAVSHIPSAAGIALGVDRLVMVLLGLQSVEDVIAFPASTLFYT